MILLVHGLALTQHNMFKLVKEDKINGSDSVPVFKVLLSNSQYDISEHISSPTISSTATLTYESKYAYVDEVGREYRLSYTTSNSYASEEYSSVYLETIYGSIVPTHLYKVVADITANKWIIYANEGILLLNGVLIRYDTLTVDNDYELCDFRDIVVGDANAEEVNSDITLLHLPRLLVQPQKLIMTMFGIPCLKELGVH